MVEERPFQRVSQRLLGKDSLLKSQPRQLPSPPPEGAEAENGPAESAEDFEQRHEKFRDDVLLDFAALESSVIRMQQTLSANAHERARYAAEKAKILAAAQSVRENTVELRTQLAEAETAQKLRKGYDKLASELIDPKKLPSRPETKEDIARLEKEIEDLQQESAEFEGVWQGRREAFERVAVEGRGLVNVIKGIKDEPEAEKDEVMDEGEDGPGTKGERSRMGTPIPEGTPLPGENTPLPGGSTPIPGELRFPTPVEEGEERLPTNKFLDVEGLDMRANSSRNGSPALQPSEGQADVEMGDEKALDDPEAEDEVKEMMEMEVITPAEGDMDES